MYSRGRKRQKKRERNYAPRKNDPRKGNEVKSRRFPHICVPHFPTSDKKRIQENERNTREF